MEKALPQDVRSSLADSGSTGHSEESDGEPSPGNLIPTIDWVVPVDRTKTPALLDVQAVRIKPIEVSAAVHVMPELNGPPWIVYLQIPNLVMTIYPWLWVHETRLLRKTTHDETHKWIIARAGSRDIEANEWVLVVNYLDDKHRSYLAVYPHVYPDVPHDQASTGTMKRRDTRAVEARSRATVADAVRRVQEQAAATTNGLLKELLAQVKVVLDDTK